MKSGTLAFVTLVALAAAARGGLEIEVPLISPAPKRPPAKAAVSDPAEPPLTVAASSAGPSPAVTSSARGTVIKLNAPGSSRGSVGLTFKGSAPPMRLTLTLAQMPSYDLESLTLNSGTLALAVGPVWSAPTTRYFDAAGRALKGPEGAAYTVTARRWDGELDVQVKRAPGAALGKALTASWQFNVVYSGLWGRR